MKKIIVMLFSAVALCSCNDRVKPSGNLINMERPTGEFTALDVRSGIKASVIMSEEPHLKITADDNIMPYIETYKKGGTLIVKVRKNTSIKGDATMNVEIQAVHLTGISASGGSRITFPEGINRAELNVSLSGGSRWNGVIEAGSMEVSLSGGSKWDGHIKAGVMEAELSGGSVMKAEGSAAEFTLECSGGSDFNWDGYGFSADAVNADLSGGSRAKATVGKSLEVDASGGSRFYYKGDPSDTEINYSGGSTVKQEEEKTE